MQIYFNQKQIDFLNARQRISLFLGGRGSGKSTAIAGKTRIRMAALPRAKCFFASTTYNQILTKTLPPIEKMFESMGIREHKGDDDPGHYVLGKKPPKHFERPISPPRKYNNIMTFVNGYCIEFLSMDRPDLARGGSYDGGDIDEAALLSNESFTKVLLPSVRDNIHRYSHWIHQQVNLYTSMPWLSRGQWILEYEEKAAAHPKDYFFIECSARDNIDILGAQWFEMMELELGYLEYLVEIENKRIRKVPDAFYNRFDDNKHGYQPIYDYVETEGLDQVRGMKDVNEKELLELSFDFSGWFNCCSVWQEHKGEERCLRQFHVKDEEKIDRLVQRICDHFSRHKFKYARIWGEPRGHDRNPIINSNIYEIIAAELRKRGWECEIRVEAKRTTNHIERHSFVNKLLSEDDPNLPKVRFNIDHCKDIIIAMQVTAINPDFTKNKSKEKDRSFPQEHAPHYTDTADYYLVQKHGWKVSTGTRRSAGSVIIR